ncbi:cellulose biosynthesis protein BcsQ [Rahnella woolbedingensis]|uniref:Cellulose synthase operon protein YhjQ n=1 Tax=Rahnella woolbedingensis TaxID=1510574 RepID=A0A419N8M8_9GAMM|nr:cellulose biosynthesis protein BcsQ [Rahnella woolbedingensis]RJT44031.1 cellulose synthase operon protein YhjQ [Rahnella woolbedingensis]
MAVITLQGFRGGTGTTSVTAALAWGLAQLNEKVLVIDFSPENILRLHFGMPFAQTRGWCSAHKAGEAWQKTAMRYHSHLDFLPYGHVTGEDVSQADFDWPKAITQLKNTGVYDWILIDSPAADPLPAQALADSTVVLLHADTQSHIRLHQHALAANGRYLLNQFIPSSQLQQDILLLWQETLPALIPVILHRDEAMAESLAAKQPVGEWKDNSKIAREMNTLANWFLLNLRQPHAVRSPAK